MVEGWELGPKSRHGELGRNTTVGFRRLIIEEICRCLGMKLLTILCQLKNEYQCCVMLSHSINRGVFSVEKSR